MRSTAVLREEHRWILRMLQCLERVTLFSDRDGHLDAACAAELLALFKYFADGLHQEREERFLFPRLLARAHSVAERTEVGRLCGEHEQERRAMARMNQELLGAIYGQGRSLHEFRREALRYIALQRQHVLHENLTLLALAERLLRPEDDELVMQGFADLEREQPGGLARAFGSVEYLCARLGVDTATTA
jgi:hemerythrin-like domain-containing protein